MTAVYLFMLYYKYLILVVVALALGGCAYNSTVKGSEYPTYAQACRQAGGVLWRTDAYSDYECVDEEWASAQLRKQMR